MKKTVSLSIIFVILEFNSYAMNGNLSSDTVWIKFKNGVLLQLSGNDLDHSLPGDLELNSTLKNFLNSWEEIKIREISSIKKMEIHYEINNPSNKISIREKDTNESYLLAYADSFKFSIPDWNSLDFNLHKVHIRLYFSRISQLKEVEEMETGNLFLLLRSKLKSTQSIYPINRWYIYTTDKELFLVHLERTNSNQNDIVLIELGTHIELIQGIWTAGFSGSISTVFSRKLIQSSKYSIFYDNVFDFSSSGSIVKNHINHFLGLGYSRNFAVAPGTSSWYGLSLNYLVKQQGTLFKKNTFYIALSKDFSNHLDLQPEIYFNNFFKNVYPSLKMSVHF